MIARHWNLAQLLNDDSHICSVLGKRTYPFTTGSFNIYYAEILSVFISQMHYRTLKHKVTR